MRERKITAKKIRRIVKEFVSYGEYNGQILIIVGKYNPEPWIDVKSIKDAKKYMRRAAQGKYPRLISYLINNYGCI